MQPLGNSDDGNNKFAELLCIAPDLTLSAQYIFQLLFILIVVLWCMILVYFSRGTNRKSFIRIMTAMIILILSGLITTASNFVSKIFLFFRF